MIDTKAVAHTEK